MQINDFEWDEGNATLLPLRHGIEPYEAEEVFAVRPLYRKTRKGHYAAFGPTLGDRFLVIIFERKKKGLIRPITGWDMSAAEKRYYRQRIRR